MTRRAQQHGAELSGHLSECQVPSRSLLPNNQRAPF
jgi:hypothetical protein